MFIDTHCHLNLMAKSSFEKPLSAQDCQNALIFIDEAQAEKVTTLFTIGTSLIESINCIMLAKEYSSVYAVIGTHPNDATDTWQEDITEYKKLLAQKEKNKIQAIGECGLDRHYPGYNYQRQESVFKAQIELALEHNLPLVIHTRDAGDEVLKILSEYTSNGVHGVIHCFSENSAFAQDAYALNFKIGIGGTVTYPKNNYLRELVKTMPLDSLLLETDAPFLPPQSLRGKQNKPAYIRMIAEYIAELRNQSLETIAEITTKNARKLFKLD
jgi:TatD DNase family protein